jgi:hypothetical protein
MLRLMGVKRCTAIGALLLASACARGTQVADQGEGCPLPMTMGDGQLQIDPPEDGYAPSISESKARDLAKHPVSQPGDASTVTAFRLGRVTLAGNYASEPGAAIGTMKSTEAWVELHQVAEGNHLPNAMNGQQDPSPYRWAVLVNADTGALATWEGVPGSGCA